MSIERDFQESVELKCLELFEETGFSKYRKDRVDYAISSDFKCWVAYSSYFSEDRLNFIPNIGVHAVTVEKFIAKTDLSKLKKYNRGVATYSLNLGSIESLNQEKEISFSLTMSDKELSEEAKRMVGLYKGAGLEYAESIANYEALVRLLKTMTKSLGGFPQRYATCLHFLDRTEEAKEFLSSMPKEDQGAIDSFIEPFMKL